MSDTAKIPGGKKPRKLTRAQVAEGLQSVPIDTIVLGVASTKETRLTSKQRAFAEGVAMGKPAAKAYREAYDTQAAPIHVGHQAHRLKQDPKIAAQIDALRLANEARKYATPAALRALVIERLTATAIDDDIKPAQRLRALELLGKVTEVAAFTERREIVQTTDAGSARAALLENLRAALRAQAIDVPALPVIAQDADPGAAAEGQGSDPTGAAPPARAARSAHTLLSNPHNESPSFSESNLPDDQNAITQTSPDATVTPVIGLTLTTVTPVTVLGENPNEEGGVGIKSSGDMTDGDMGKTPGGVLE
jgi:hypothetical protein